MKNSSTRYKISRSKRNSAKAPEFDATETLLHRLNQLRSHGGIEDPADFAVSIAALLFFKWLEAQEEEALAIAEFEGEKYRSCIKPEHSIATWYSHAPSELSRQVERHFLPSIRSASGSEYADLAIRMAPGIEVFLAEQPQTQQAALDVIVEIGPSTPKGRAEGLQLIEATLEWLVQSEGAKSGIYATPNNLVDIMVDLGRPRPGERIYDPCFGTGGLLTTAARHRMSDTKATDSAGWHHIRRNGIYGREQSLAGFLIGVSRLVYQGVEFPRLEIGNSLEAEAFDGRSGSGYDCIFANIPMGVKVPEQRAHHFPIPMKDGDGIFLQHIIQSLREGGRAVVLIRPSLLFQGGKLAHLREYLVEGCDLEQVISLPKGILKPYTNVAPSMLVFRKGASTAKVKFSNLTNVPLPADNKAGLTLSKLAEDSRAYTYEITREEIEERNWDLAVKEAGTDEFELEIGEVSKRFNEVSVTPLEKLAALRKGFAYTSQITTKERPTDDEAVGLLRVGDLVKGTIEEPEMFLNRDGLAKASKGVYLSQGDILLSSAGTVGKLAIYQSDSTKTKAVASSGLLIIRPNDRTVSGEYLYALLASEAYQNWMAANSTGVTSIARLGIKDIKNLQIPVPPIKVQERVARHAIDHLGDAFNYLKRTLSEAGEDPFISWLEESKEIVSLIDYSRNQRERNRLLVIQEAGISSRVMRNRAVHESSGMTTAISNLLPWLARLGDAGGKLVSVAGLEDLPERFNLLNTAALQLEAANLVVPDSRSSLPRRAKLIGDSLLSLIQAELKDIQARQRVVVEVLDYSLPEDLFREVRVDVHNLGPLTLREIEVLGVEFKWSNKIPILSPGQRKEFAISIDQDLLPSLTLLTFRITGTHVDDTPFSREITCELTEFLRLPEFKSVRRMWTSRDREDLKARRALQERKVRALDLFEEVEGASALAEATSDSETKASADDRERLQERKKRALELFEQAEATASLKPPKKKATLKDIGSSPYNVGSPVKNESMLYGRDQVLRLIARQLSAEDRPNVILLEGNRRTGKTSILKRIETGKKLKDWEVTYCSLQESEGRDDVAGLATSEIWRTLAKNIGRSLIKLGYTVPLPGDVAYIEGKSIKLQFQKACRTAFKEDYPFETFENFLEECLELVKPKRLLLMLDEFDKIQEGIDSGVTSPQVPENIRYLIHEYPQFAVILTGSRRLKRLREEYWSALFGFGHREGVSALSAKDAAALVTEPVKGRLNYIAEAVDEIVEVTGRQPYIVQNLCNRIFEYAAEHEERRITLAIVRHATEDLIEDSEHFRNLWAVAETKRRQLILAIVQKSDHQGFPLSLSLLEEELIQHGIFIPKGERVADDLAFLREFELIRLKGEAPNQYYVMEIPLFGTWIDRHIDFEDILDEARTEGEKSGL